MPKYLAVFQKYSAMPHSSELDTSDVVTETKYGGEVFYHILDASTSQEALGEVKTLWKKRPLNIGRVFLTQIISEMPIPLWLEEENAQAKMTRVAKEYDRAKKELRDLKDKLALDQP